MTRDTLFLLFLAAWAVACVAGLLIVIVDRDERATAPPQIVDALYMLRDCTLGFVLMACLYWLALGVW